MNERISAWMDGELSRWQSRHLPLQLADSAEYRINWNCYHLIGDTLRDMRCTDLCDKIRTQLDAEPTVLAPLRRGMAERLHSTPLAVTTSIAAFIFVGGILMALPGLKQGAPQTAVVEVNQPPVPAGADMQVYLLAHRRFSHGPAWPVRVQYLHIANG